MLWLLTLPVIQIWIFICGFVWLGLHREIGRPRLGNCFLSSHTITGVLSHVPLICPSLWCSLLSSHPCINQGSSEKQNQQEREREVLLKTGLCNYGAGKSKICLADVPVWVRRLEAAVELGREDVSVWRPPGRRIRSYLGEGQPFVLLMPSTD